MDTFGLIGYPVSHSLSPRLFKAAYGGRYAYELIETDDFEEAWKRFSEGFRAVNVTAPFKALAAAKADWRSPEVEMTGAANILVRNEDGSVSAYNSDYRAILGILRRLGSGGPGEKWTTRPFKEGCPSGYCEIAVIGSGGAGAAALAAARALSRSVRLYHHDEITGGVDADIVIHTLPRPVPGLDRICCRALIEANYKDPCLGPGAGYDYISGTEWLLGQAIEGYPVMTGEQPDIHSMKQAIEKDVQ